MANLIIHKKSGVADKVPLVGDLANGELAINYTDQIAYGGNGSVIFEIGANVAIQKIRTSITVGNSTVNVFANSTLVRVVNSTASANITPNQFITGISSVNATHVSVGANVIISSAGMVVGDADANLVINSTAVWIGNSTSNTRLTVPTAVQYAATNYFLHANGSWVEGGGGSGTPGGADKEIQFNDGGAFGGNVLFQFDKTTTRVLLGNSTVNVTANTSHLNFNDPSGSSAVNPFGFFVGTTVVNSSVVFIGNSTNNNFSNSTLVAVTNSTSNINMTSSDITKSGVSIIPFGRQSIWIPASAMIPRTTTGPAYGVVEMATNDIMWNTLDFDASANEHAQFWISFPKSWNEGTVEAQFYWSQSNTTTNFGVVWGIAGVAFSDDDPTDTALGTYIFVSDTGGTNNDLYISANSAGVTIAGTPTANDMVCFEVKRWGSNTTVDTMTVDARLHGVKLFFTTDAAKDD